MRLPKVIFHLFSSAAPFGLYYRWCRIRFFSEIKEAQIARLITGGYSYWSASLAGAIWIARSGVEVMGRGDEEMLFDIGALNVRRRTSHFGHNPANSNRFWRQT